MSPQKMEIFKSLESWAEQNMLMHLKPVEKCWQPSDFLPEPESEEFHEQVKELRESCKELPDEYLNRHGVLLNIYLYLSGRVDTKQIEKTIQYLIGSGMDPKFENNPYNGFIYTSFQERATFITHGNTAKLAKDHGDMKLARICGTITADEKRHEIAYTKVVEKLFEMDPDDSILSLAAMMKKKIKLPAHLIYDGHDDNLFKQYSAVVQRIGVYTAKDYADILEFLVGRWNVEKLESGLSGEG
ncbi:hypothetical protein QYF36_006646 [Acer negundo]|nr:hypothetical protein QYF36_006646 [Acer negundo]